MDSTCTFSLDVISKAPPGGPSYDMYVEVLMLSRRSFRVITSSCLDSQNSVRDWDFPRIFWIFWISWIFLNFLFGFWGFLAFLSDFWDVFGIF